MKSAIKPMVLVTDDDPSVRLLTRTVLEENGFDVIEAENGFEALTAYTQDKPDLVIMDSMMPEKDGITSCKELRQLPGGEHVPVLMVTSIDDVESIHKAFDLGVTDYIVKPINWAVLGYRVRCHIRSSRLFNDLKINEKRLAKAHNIARLGNWEWNLNTQEMYWSDGMTKIFEHSQQDGKPNFQTVLNLIHPDDIERVSFLIERARAGLGVYTTSYRVLLPDDRTRHLNESVEFVYSDKNELASIQGTVQDVTERTHIKEMLEEKEKRVEYLSNYDSLTGLPNRLLANDRLEHALSKANRTGHKVAIILIDLDRFKRVNDFLGHEKGDHIIKQLAKRLDDQCVRSADTLARLGGDEFIIILEQIDRVKSISYVAEGILKILKEPISIDEHNLVMTSSIGISVYPDNGPDVESLMKCADVAMYRVKSEGGDNYHFYAEEMTFRAKELFSMENRLWEALEKNQFELFYQPQVDMKTNELIGMEALIRWIHPELGIVSPADFIPLAEETGLILPIGDWVLRTACEQNKKWQEAGCQPVTIAVNVSARQFGQSNLVAKVCEVLKETSLEPQYLQIELTESAIMNNAEQAIKIMSELVKIGVSIAIDDFGSGYSSLSYLKQFPIDKLKIDRSFIKDIHIGPKDYAITTSIVSLAENLNLNVIAEGIENEEHVDLLLDIGCKEAQGFLFGRPVPEKEFSQFFYKTANVNTM